MKLIPSNVGANRRNIVILGALMATLIGVFFYNSQSESTPAAAKTVPLGATPEPLKPVPASQVVPVGRARPTLRTEDFRPTLKLPEGTDVSRIDPTLHLELLAKLKAAEMKGGQRSLFAFGAAPLPEIAALHPGEMAANFVGPRYQQAKEPEKPAGPPPKPPPPPIPLKFYGYSTKSGTKRAFFLDSDNQIEVAGENETIRNRYKVIRIGVNSVVVEDTQNKNQQTLPLVEEMAG